MMCYEEACRLCLNTLQGPGIDCSIIVEMREAIQELFGFEITKKDVTKSVCNKCFQIVMFIQAFKKTVTECQSSIHAYKTIKNKILQRGISVKQEVIDLCEQEQESNGKASTSKRPKRRLPIPSQVTDSQINDILDLVHDNNNKGMNLRKVSNKSKAIPPQITTVKAEQTTTDPGENCTEPVPSQNNGKNYTDPVSTRHNGSDSSTQSYSNVASMGNEENCTNTVPSRDSERDSSTQSNSIVELSVLGNGKEPDRRRSSICVISTSGIPGTSQTDIKVELENIITDVPAVVETAADAVTSSVPTPTKDNEEALSQLRPLKKNPPNITPLHAMLLKCISNNANESSSNVSTASTSTTSKSPENITTDFEIKLGITNFSCPQCSKQFESEEDIDRHAKEHEEVSESETIVKRGRKRRSNEKDKVTPKRRSARIANSQALRKLLNSQKQPRRSTSENSEVPQVLAQLSLSQPSAAVPSPKSSATLSTSSTPDETITRTPLNTGNRDSNKRVITITLLRSSETVSFKYCDQDKNIIDFDAVTPDELSDIRGSLMSPHVWNNLTKVFQASRPTDDTIQQLRTIFGQKMSM